MSRLSILIMLIISVSGVTAYPETYYVDQNHPQANNTNAGTVGLPWLTMQHAVNTIHAGDTLYVKSGTYSGVFTISKLSGVSDKQTIVQTYPGEQVALEGLGVNTGRIKIDSCDYLTFKGFEVTTHNQGIFITGGCSYITLDSVEVHNIGQEGIHVKENSHHIVIQNSKVYDTDKWDYNGEGFYIGTGSAGPIDSTSYVTVRNCVIYNTVDEAIEFKPGTHGCIAEGNLIYNIVTSKTVGVIEINEDSLGVQNCSGNPEHIVRNNIIYSSSTAIRAGTGCSVYNNVIYSLTADNYGIYVNSRFNDTYTRYIYHNTINLPTTHAVFVQSGQADIKNNIGPSEPGNIEAGDSYFVSVQAGNEDFHLVAGSAPIDSGTDCGISEDFDGNPRPYGTAPDMGAYEYGVVEIKQKEIQNHAGVYQNTIQVIPKKSFVEINYNAVDKSSITLIAIYDLSGNVIVQLPFQHSSETVTWNGNNTKGNKCTSGCYLVYVKSKGQTVSQRFMFYH